MKITIELAEQTLHLLHQGKVLRRYAISSAANGPGQQKNSGCTPLGMHIVRAKIGEHCDPLSVFVGRRFTGELYSPELAARHPQRDWILARILWLSGCEKGFNRLGDCDSMQRYIYIHGTPETEPMGVPRSHGCIRMRINDILELFAATPIGTRVEILYNGARFLDNPSSSHAAQE